MGLECLTQSRNDRQEIFRRIPCVFTCLRVAASAKAGVKPNHVVVSVA